MVTGGTDQDHQALRGFDALEWRVKCQWVCMCKESSGCMQEVIGIPVSWPICVRNLWPASVYTWVWCLRHITVAFLSKALNPVEQRYKIHDTEMLAIIRGLEEWRHYLEGVRHPVEIWTNHKNVEYVQVAQELNHWQARWSLYLSHFFTLHHKPGQSMGKTDALSRWANHGSGQGDNDNLTLLAPELFRIHALAGARLKGEEHNILWEVCCSLRDDVQEESVAKAAI
jgi:hypothetical protein